VPPIIITGGYIALACNSTREVFMQGKHNEQMQLKRKLVLHKETVRVLTEQELAGIEGGIRPTLACSGTTCRCGGTCGNNLSTCPPP